MSIIDAVAPTINERENESYELARKVLSSLSWISVVNVEQLNIAFFEDIHLDQDQIDLIIAYVKKGKEISEKSVGKMPAQMMDDPKIRNLCEELMQIHLPNILDIPELRNERIFSWADYFRNRVPTIEH